MANRHSIVDKSKLYGTVVEDLREYNEDNPKIKDDSLGNILEAFLQWNGIIGFTSQILNIVEAANDPPPR